MPDASFISGQLPAKPQPPVSSPPKGEVLWLIVPVALTLLACLVVLLPQIPLGLPGEWVWNRVGHRPSLIRFIVPLGAFAIYACLTVFGYRWLKGRAERWVCLLLPVILAAGGFLQLTWLDVPTPSFALGMERWPLSLYYEATSGYFAQAKRISDLPTFLANYEDWLANQGSFHMGTHPPGLIVANCLLLDFLAEHAVWSQRLQGLLPGRLVKALSMLGEQESLTSAEQTTLGTVALLTWAAALATLLPLYALARIGLPPATAWLAAAFWPTVPAIPLFLPLADCLFPLLAVTVVALVLWSAELRLGILAILGGLILWLGMFTTPAFLAVLPIAGGALTMRLCGPSAISIKRWLITLVTLGVGVALPTQLAWHELDLNLPVIWWLNLDKHAGFYDAMPRSYAPWVAINLLEMASVCGPALFAVALTAPWRRAYWVRMTAVEATVACWLLTILILDLSGRNLSEVARLWIFLTPFACLGLARAHSDRAAEEACLLTWLACQAVMALVLISAVEPLLPIALG